MTSVLSTRSLLACALTALAGLAVAVGLTQRGHNRVEISELTLGGAPDDRPATALA